MSPARGTTPGIHGKLYSCGLRWSPGHVPQDEPGVTTLGDTGGRSLTCVVEHCPKGEDEYQHLNGEADHPGEHIVISEKQVLPSSQFLGATLDWVPYKRSKLSPHHRCLRNAERPYHPSDTL